MRAGASIAKEIVRRWKGVKTKRNLTIEQGPNNPVGLVWIDLTAPSYGIHGTPDPEDIGKTQSHGCIRLTNWDAVDLAAMARPGTVVRFDDQDLPVAPRSVPVGERQLPEVKGWPSRRQRRRSRQRPRPRRRERRR